MDTGGVDFSKPTAEFVFGLAEYMRKLNFTAKDLLGVVKEPGTWEKIKNAQEDLSL